MNDIQPGEQLESGDHPMSFLLDDENSIGFPQVGEIREGYVVAHRGNEILVDIGAKSEGIIAGPEVDSLGEEEKALLEVGNQVSVYVVDPDSDGNIILSYAKALEEEDWKRADSFLESQEVFQGKVVGYNRGGLLVMLGRVRGFVPASQVGVRRSAGSFRGSNEERLRSLVGEEIFARVIEVDRGRNRLILSERAAQREVLEAQRAKILQELEVGEIRDGRVVNLADFGAFVDIGGLEGLVHLSELSWKRVNHPADVLEVGSKVQVYVLNVDEERKRVGLSMKRLEPDPWTTIDEMYREGELVEATISKLTKYGAFARISDDYGLEGLIHVSEMSEDRVENPQDIVQQGQLVTARIIRIDPEQRQIGLSLKQVSSQEFLESDLALAEELETN